MYRRALANLLSLFLSSSLLIPLFYKWLSDSGEKNMSSAILDGWSESRCFILLPLWLLWATQCLDIARELSPLHRFSRPSSRGCMVATSRSTKYKQVWMEWMFSFKVHLNFLLRSPHVRLICFHSIQPLSSHVLTLRLYFHLAQLLMSAIFLGVECQSGSEASFILSLPSSRSSCQTSLRS